MLHLVTEIFKEKWLGHGKPANTDTKTMQLSLRLEPMHYGSPAVTDSASKTHYYALAGLDFSKRALMLCCCYSCEEALSCSTQSLCSHYGKCADLGQTDLCTM